MIALHGKGGSQPVTDTGPPSRPDFSELYAAYFQSLTVQLFAYTNDMGTAQEVVQEAFCRALARWKKIALYDDPAAWVRRVAWNLAINRWRRARIAAHFLRRQREEYAPAPSPDRVALADALKELPAQQRRAVILYYLADLPTNEIAHQEGVAEATVRSWLHRGRTALAARLSGQEERHV